MVSEKLLVAIDSSSIWSFPHKFKNPKHFLTMLALQIIMPMTLALGTSDLACLALFRLMRLTLILILKMKKSFSNLVMMKLSLWKMKKFFKKLISRIKTMTTLFLMQT
jgi:hypothetical protein